MNKNRRYKHTKVRDKQPIIRSLNTFSKQYKYIYAEEIEVDLNLKPLNLYYKDDEVVNDLSKIYSRIDSEIDLQNYHLICEAIDSLFGIGSTEWKEKLKKEIHPFGFDNTNYFLSDKFEDQAKYIISKYSANTKIYNYIKNYIKYSHSGIYQLSKTKRLKVKPIDTIESFEKRLKYLNAAKGLYLKTLQEIKEEYDQLQKILQAWEENPDFDSDALKKDNTSYFHPIDDSEQSDTLSMIQRKESGLYDEETLEKLHHWDENVLRLKKKLEEKLKPLKYTFDIHFDFETMKDFQHFYIEDFRETKIFKIAEEFQEELKHLLENAEQYTIARQEFFDLVEQDEDDDTYEWVKEMLLEWEGFLFNSRYTHKLRETTYAIIEGLLSSKVKDSFDQLSKLGMGLLNFEQDKTDDIQNMIEELNTILEYEDEEEIDYEFLAEQCKEALDEKDDYKISDLDYLIECGLVRNEEEWDEVQWYIQKK